MNKPKHISEFTDRELMEKIAMRAAEGAEAAKWIKSYIVVSSIIGVILFVIALMKT